MPTEILADATDLHQWAGTLEAESVFPELIRRLVYATSKGIEHA